MSYCWCRIKRSRPSIRSARVFSAHFAYLPLQKLPCLLFSLPMRILSIFFLLFTDLIILHFGSDCKTADTNFAATQPNSTKTRLYSKYSFNPVDKLSPSAHFLQVLLWKRKFNHKISEKGYCYHVYVTLYTLYAGRGRLYEADKSSQQTRRHQQAHLAILR